MQYRFGEFRLDLQAGQLHGPDGPVVLRRQAWRLLLELLEQAPALIERDLLLDRVWGRSALSPNALPQTISELRQALGDDARKPRYIETCHGRGYRMVCAVEKPDAGLPDSSAKSGPGLRASGWRGFPAAVPIGGVALALVVSAVWLWPDRSPMVAGEQIANAERSQSLRRQAEVALARHDPASAAAHLRALTLLQPNDSELALQLAAAELDALQGEQARRTLSLLAADPTLHQDPQRLILQARLAEVDGDLEQAARLAEAARHQAHSLDQPGFYLAAVRLQARAAQRQGELEVAAETLAAAIADSDTLLGREQRFELVLDLAILRREQGRLELAREGIAQAESLSTDQASLDRLTIEKALLQSSNGQPRQAWQQLQALADRAEAEGSPTLRLAWFNAAGSVGMELGETEQALAAFERGFALARASGQAYSVAGLQINTGSLLARRDRFEEAERLWQQALETFEQIGDRRGRATALGNLAAAASAQGHNSRARMLNGQALEEFRQLRLDGPQARTAFNLGLIASREGALDEAEQLLAEAQEAYLRAGHVELVLHVGAVRADHRLLAADPLRAEALLVELEALKAQASPLRQAAVLASRGRLAQWSGDLAGARAALEQAHRLRIESGQDGWIATSELELMQLALVEGDDPWRLRVEALALADRFDAISQGRAAARARLLAAEALLSQGEAQAARSELARIRADLLQFNDSSLALDLAWVEAWAARDEERLPRLEALARRAMNQGFFGKLVQVEAGLIARGLALNELLDDSWQRPESVTAAAISSLPAYAAWPEPLSSPE